MDFSCGGGGMTLSEMYQSVRRLLLSTCDGVAHVKRLASAPASSYSVSAPPVGAPDLAGAEAVRRRTYVCQRFPNATANGLFTMFFGIFTHCLGVFQ
ncbi:hypothetical protein ZWY2020_021620 [Hordeum vulgare]|nr:hypothetical protein ZWY2020_021620 [Hordeum vulgare]